MYPEDPRQPFYDISGKEMLPLARMYFTREKLIPKACDDDILESFVNITDENEDDANKRNHNFLQN